MDLNSLSSWEGSLGFFISYRLGVFGPYLNIYRINEVMKKKKKKKKKGKNGKAKKDL